MAPRLLGEERTHAGQIRDFLTVYSITRTARATMASCSCLTLSGLTLREGQEECCNLTVPHPDLTFALQGAAGGRGRLAGSKQTLRYRD